MLKTALRFPGAHTVAYIRCWTGSLANPIIISASERYRDAVIVLIFKKFTRPCQSDEAYEGKRLTMRIESFRARKTTGSVDAV